jgi:hypothetical protein
LRSNPFLEKNSLMISLGKKMSADTKKPEKEDIVWLNDIKKSREIVREILRFGVTQTQMKNVISILALELEDRDLMISIRSLLEPSEESESSEQSDDSSQTKLIYPGGMENE